MRDIGKNIRDLRIRANMTQDELAEKLFVTRQTVSNYETGRSRPDVDMLANIAQALNTDPNTILYGPAQADSKTYDWLGLGKAVAILAAAYTVYACLYNLFYYLAHIYLTSQPRIWLEVMGKPMLYLLFGWTVMRILHTFHPIPFFRPETARKVRISLIWVLTVYLLFMGSFLVLAPFLNENSPALSWGWSLVFYTLLGVGAGQTRLHIHLICFLLMGVLFWLSKTPDKKIPSAD